MTRLKSLTDLQDALDNEHAWRIKEIANIKLAIRSDNMIGKETLIRAGVPLLYAHWEGFIKAASSLYLEYVENQKLKYCQLSNAFIAYGAKKHLSSLANSNVSQLHIAAVDFFLQQIGDKASIYSKSAISTRSNLKSSVFRNIAISLGIDVSRYETRFIFIDEILLEKRNRIAHGEYLDLKDRDFVKLCDNVLVLLRNYYDDISNAAATKGYKRPD